MTSLGGAKSGSLDFLRSREGLGSIWVDLDWCQDPQNLIISLFGPFGGQFGPIFPYYPIIWGFPLGSYWLLLAPVGSYWCLGAEQVTRQALAP